MRKIKILAGLINSQEQGQELAIITLFSVKISGKEN
jgi:hypothetical protein